MASVSAHLHGHHNALGGSNSNITHFLGVTCYQSDDLVNWSFVRNVLTPEAAGWAYWVGRMGVAYIPEAQKYALLTQFNDLAIGTWQR